MEKISDVVVAEVMNNVNTLSTKIEQLTAKKKALSEPGEESVVGKVLTAHKAALEAIKTESKAARTAIEEQLKRLDVFSACQVATTVCMSPEGADDAFRQRMARRRGALKSALAKTFTDYDVRVDKIANRAVLTPVYVGNEFSRSANSMLAVVASLKDLGYAMPDISRDELADILQKQAGVSKVYQHTPVDDNVPSVMDTLKALDALIQPATVESEVADKKAAKKEKAA